MMIILSYQVFLKTLGNGSWMRFLSILIRHRLFLHLGLLIEEKLSFLTASNERKRNSRCVLMILQLSMIGNKKKLQMLSRNSWPYRPLWNLSSILVLLKRRYNTVACQDLAGKSEVLASSPTSSSKVVDEVLARKRIGELERFLEESSESQRKVEDGLNVMRQENLYLFKELDKFLKRGFLYHYMLF